MSGAESASRSQKDGGLRWSQSSGRPGIPIARARWGAPPSDRTRWANPPYALSAASVAAAMSAFGAKRNLLPDQSITGCDLFGHQRLD